jgi:hypothetical protein
MFLGCGGLGACLSGERRVKSCSDSESRGPNAFATLLSFLGFGRIRLLGSVCSLRSYADRGRYSQDPKTWKGEALG